MKSNELKTKIIENVKENIAVSNIRKDLNMNRTKNKRVFYKIALASCAVFVILALIITHNISIDITLKYGKDLFEDRLHIKANELTKKITDFCKLDSYQYKKNRNDARYFWNKKFNADYNYQKFINEINNAEFIDGTNIDIYSLKKKQAHLYFGMKDGTTVDIRLNEDGYISYGGWHERIFVKINTDTFEKIFKEATLTYYIYPIGK